jgi:hypothetical protein
MDLRTAAPTRPPSGNAAHLAWPNEAPGFRSQPPHHRHALPDVADGTTPDKHALLSVALRVAVSDSPPSLQATIKMG